MARVADYEPFYILPVANPVDDHLLGTEEVLPGTPGVVAACGPAAADSPYGCAMVCAEGFLEGHATAICQAKGYAWGTRAEAPLLTGDDLLKAGAGPNLAAFRCPGGRFTDDLSSCRASVTESACTPAAVTCFDGEWWSGCHVHCLHVHAYTALLLWL